MDWCDGCHYPTCLCEFPVEKRHREWVRRTCQPKPTLEERIERIEKLLEKIANK